MELTKEEEHLIETLVELDLQIEIIMFDIGIWKAFDVLCGMQVERDVLAKDYEFLVRSPFDRYLDGQPNLRNRYENYRRIVLGYEIRNELAEET